MGDTLGYVAATDVTAGVSQNRFALCEETEFKEIGAELCFDVNFV